MASLTEAYARVRETTARNNAAREEDGGVLQEVFTGILGELNEDLDPANVERPLSPMGELLDSVIPFKQRQIEKAAEARARVEQASFTAEADIRKAGYAEQLDAQLVSAAAKRASENIALFKKNIPSLQLDELSDISFMEAAVASDPSLAPIIAQRNASGHLFRVLPKEAEEKIEYGQLIFTHKQTGQKLYSTGDSSAKNLNFAYNRLSKELTKNLLESGFSKKEILNIPSEDRIKLFENKDFRKVLETTVANIPPKLFEAHEIYNTAIKKHTENMTTRLDKRITAINRAIVTQQQTVQKHLLSRETRREILAQKSLDEITKLEESLFGLQVGGNYRRAVSAEVTKIAFALSLMKKEKVTPETAEVNIQAAIQIARNSGKLKDFKRAHEVYYKDGVEKIRAGVTKKAPPPPETERPPESRKPAVRKRATSESIHIPDPAGYVGG